MRATETSATLYAQGNKFFLQTPQASLWQDGQYVATVMHAQQLIYLTRVPPGSPAQGAPTQFIMLRDSLIQRGKLTQCETTVVEGKKYQHVQLSLAASDQARYHVTALGFLLDTRSHIYELTVLYPNSMPIGQVVYRITKQEFINSSAKLPVSARAMVVNKENQPLKAYHNYRVVDHTKLTRLPY
jgi:hypothetical protein